MLPRVRSSAGMGSRTFAFKPRNKVDLSLAATNGHARACPYRSRNHRPDLYGPILIRACVLKHVRSAHCNRVNDVCDASLFHQASNVLGPSIRQCLVTSGATTLVRVSSHNQNQRWIAHFLPHLLVIKGRDQLIDLRLWDHAATDLKVNRCEPLHRARALDLVRQLILFLLRLSWHGLKPRQYLFASRLDIRIRERFWICVDRAAWRCRGCAAWGRR